MCLTHCSCALQSNRFDILFCLKLKGKFNPNAGVDILHFLMKWFAKFILFPVVRPFVLLVFGITTTLSLVFLFRLDIGLDQTLAFPKVCVWRGGGGAGTE